jgi:hypothetical protein
MDPATAIGIASSAIAFLQFTYQFSTTLFSIITDGTSGPVQYDNLEEICHKMKDISLDIELSQKGGTTQSPIQMAVLSLSSQCRLLAERILRKLEKIKPANRKLISTIKATVKYIYSKEEFSILQKNLDTCRGQLHLHLSTLHK